MTLTIISVVHHNNLYKLFENIKLENEKNLYTYKKVKKAKEKTMYNIYNDNENKRQKKVFIE